MASTMQNSTICLPLNKKFHYCGVFYKQNPLDYVIPTNMLQIILSVVISQIFYLILGPLKQSKLVCSILAGVILGPSVLGRNKTYMEKMFGPKEMVVLGTMSHLSIYLYTFIICIRFDASMFTRATKNSWKLSLCCFVFPFVFTTSLTLWLQNQLTAIYSKHAFPIQLNVVLSMSYFIVITRALVEHNLLSSELGQLSSSITCFHEVGNCIFLVFYFASKQKEAKHKVYVVLCLCSLVMFAIFVIRPILIWIVKTTPKGKPVKESHVIAILVSFFVMGLITDAIGASFVMGCIIMGCVIPDGPPLGATIIRKCELILFEVLLPCFFVRIGYFTDLTTIHNNYKEFVIFAGILLVGYLGRLIACLLFASSLNMKKTTAILLSLILSLEGVIELIQANKWRENKVIDPRAFASTVVYIVVLNAIINPIIAICYKPAVENFGLSTTSVRLRKRSLGMTSIIEELRIITCIQDEDNVPSIISLLEAMNPKDVSSICAYVIHLVPVSSESLPRLAPYKNHLRGFSQPSGSDSIIRAFLNYAGHSQSLIKIQPFRMISQYKYMHQHICRLGETMHAPLIIVPFFKREEAHDTDGTLLIFNTNIQAIAKCTVGLLVDRGLRSPLSLTTFSYNMAVIFLGGVDDREALALASRASRNPNVRITVLRIDMSGNLDTSDAQIERGVDNTLFREFKATNVNNDNVVCDEIVAHDIKDIMKALQSLSKAYDLVIVGKRHRIPELQALASWVEYPELGEVGDAITAPDFMGARMSVLVLQHCVDKNQRVPRK